MSFKLFNSHSTKISQNLIHEALKGLPQLVPGMTYMYMYTKEVHEWRRARNIQRYGKMHAILQIYHWSFFRHQTYHCMSVVTQHDFAGLRNFQTSRVKIHTIFSPCL